MALATLDGVNHWLPPDKMVLTDQLDDEYQLDVERIIKGYLSNTFSPTTLAGWSDPTVTNPTNSKYVPGLIQAIAGRFIASFYYGKVFSSETTETPQYSQRLYDEAWDLLKKVASGELVLTDEEEKPDTGSRLGEADFYPNDPTVDAPKFAMAREF